MCGNGKPVLYFAAMRNELNVITGACVGKILLVEIKYCHQCKYALFMSPLHR